MKVLYISHTSDIHGSSKALLNIITSMIEKNGDVLVILPRKNGDFFDKLEGYKKNIIQTVPIISWIWPSLNNIRDYILFIFRSLRLFLKLVKGYRQLLSVVENYKPDVIHTNVGVIHLGYYVSKKLNIPHVWHIREFQDLHFGWVPLPSKKLFKKILLKPNNYPIAITKAVFKHYSLEKNPNAKIVYDGVVDIDSIPQIVTVRKNYFLFVGHLSEDKGVKECIEGFLSFSENNSNYELWLAGTGPLSYQEELNKIVLNSSCKNKIKFLGFRSDIYSLMSEAMALIVSSKHEGFGFITAEAMFNGCLVIGKNTAGTKEQFDNGLLRHEQEIGLRYNTKEELIKYMKNVDEKGVEYFKTMIEKAQETVVALYSKQLHTDNIYNIYKNIIETYVR